MNSLLNEFSDLNLYSSYDPQLTYIVSVDIGVKNLGICLSSASGMELKEIIWFDLIDITDFGHLKQDECELKYHSKTYSDYMEHVFYYHEELFKIAEYILLERQPPMGYTVVEQLIFSKFRSRAILISPNSIHSYFGWTREKLDYEKRKEYSVKLAELYINQQQRTYLLDKFRSYERRHDISDAICITIFFLRKQKALRDKELRRRSLEKRIRELKKKGEPCTLLKLEKFRYYRTNF